MTNDPIDPFDPFADDPLDGIDAAIQQAIIAEPGWRQVGIRDCYHCHRPCPWIDPVDTRRHPLCPPRPEIGVYGWG